MLEFRLCHSEHRAGGRWAVKEGQVRGPRANTGSQRKGGGSEPSCVSPPLSPPGVCPLLSTKTRWLFPSWCFGRTQNLIYKSNLSHNTEINAICDSQFQREEDTPSLARLCHPGPCGEAPGGSGDRGRRAKHGPGPLLWFLWEGMSEAGQASWGKQVYNWRVGIMSAGCGL